MDASLAVGLKFSDTFVVPATKTVPNLYPEATEFQEMPEVLATGFLVGLVEWTCIKAIKEYLDWPAEQSLGIRVAIDHTAATPPGLEITTSVELIEMDGKKLVFYVEAHDGVDLICKGHHDRFVVQAEKFNQRVLQKMQKES